MKNKKYVGGEELLKVFEEYLSNEDILEMALSLKISTAIIEQRTKLGMSQSDLAKLLNVKQPVLSRWENGDTNYTIRTIVEIFSALNLDFEFLIGNEAQSYRRNYKLTNVWQVAPKSHDNNITYLLAEGA